MSPDRSATGPLSPSTLPPISPAAPWRLFCAIELPANVRQRVVHHIEQLRKKVPDAPASWSPEDNIHLTIKFIGEVPQTRAENLCTAATQSVRSLSPFKIALTGAGAFPQSGAPRVLWIGIEDSSKQLAALHGRLEEECVKEGFPRDARDFHPHLTIARLRKPHGARTLASAHQQLGFDRIEIPVNELVVIRSELSSKGSRYTVLSRHGVG